MSVPEPVQTAWDDAVAHWDDPAKHQVVLGLVAQHGCFAWAAARYKERAGDPIADQQLERLRSSAVATMFAHANPRKKEPPQPYRQTLFLFVALLLALAMGMVFVKVLHDSGAH